MFRPKKSLGQNFLIDKNIVKKILSIVDLKKKNIIEIGPGTGNLTNEILKLDINSIIAIEKDKKLFEELKKNNILNNKLKIYNEDILKFHLEDKVEENTVIIGNLPYNISSQILVKLIKFKIWPPKYKKLILMFQKEVAEKIIANYKSAAFGRLTIVTNWRLKVTDHFNISKNCFFPKPKVDSTILVFEPKKIDKIKINKIENLEHITQTFFSNKRKMINKVLKKNFKNSEEILKKLKLDTTKRPSDLTCETYYKLTELYEQNKTS